MKNLQLFGPVSNWGLAIAIASVIEKAKHD